MSTESTEIHGSEEEPQDTRSRAVDAARTINERSPDGALAMLAGGALLAGAVRSTRRGRAVIQALVGAALIGLGLRQRRSEGGDVSDPGSLTHGEPGREIETRTGTIEERVESQQPDTNPRGTAAEPDVETETDPDEGEVQFTESRDGRPRTTPDLDGESPEDPRRDEDDEPVEVDLSEASMADEASEAVGPTPEQSQPTQTEATEPEQTAPEDVPHEDSGDADPTDEGEDSEDETVEEAETTDEDEIADAGEIADTGEMADTDETTDEDDEE